MILARAWQVCRLLDRIDESHRDRDMQRALALTAPRREDETPSSPLGTLVPPLDDRTYESRR